MGTVSYVRILWPIYVDIVVLGHLTLEIYAAHRANSLMKNFVVLMLFRCVIKNNLP